MRRLIFVCLIAVAIVALFWPRVVEDAKNAEQSKSNFAIYFFDVGQGDSALISTDSGKRILIDGGPSAPALLEKLEHALPYGANTIDAVILTHPHADHVGGLPAVAERYTIQKVFETCLPYRSAIYSAWEKIIAEQGIAVTCVVSRMNVSVDTETTLEILFPDFDARKKQPPRVAVDKENDLVNNTSLALRLVRQNHHIMFPGDAETAVLQKLVSSTAELSSDTLKISHHGSTNGSWPPFLDAVNPKFVIISVGVRNRYGHPTETTLRRLQRMPDVRMFRTDKDGTLKLTFEGDKTCVESTQSEERECR